MTEPSFDRHLVRRPRRRRGGVVSASCISERAASSTTCFVHDAGRKAVPDEICASVRSRTGCLGAARGHHACAGGEPSAERFPRGRRPFAGIRDATTGSCTMSDSPGAGCKYGPMGFSAPLAGVPAAPGLAVAISRQRRDGRVVGRPLPATEKHRRPHPRHTRA